MYACILVTLLGLSSCVPVVIMNPYPPRGGEHREHKDDDRGKDDDDDDDDREEKRGAYRIPKGHLPPPGHCRIWYPNRPAGQQPPPQRCPIAVRQIPLGAYVVSRLEGDNRRALVHVYSGQKPGIVVETRYYSVTE
jgi:hypothetical protein